ncbi:EF-hand_domain pair [Hexamita inflata]|uniref:EF-hand domain pair n=1 Tax=Hexamita inflata TaxID=28002 RepID=A0AA86U005_9EUKA|nr:EF-hand domain pair [Hexamita inflata]
MQLTQSQLRALFRAFDINSNQSISVQDFTNALNQVNVTESAEHVKSLLNLIQDSDQMNFSVFSRFMNVYSNQNSTDSASKHFYVLADENGKVPGTKVFEVFVKLNICGTKMGVDQILRKNGMTLQSLIDYQMFKRIQNEIEGK